MVDQLLNEILRLRAGAAAASFLEESTNSSAQLVFLAGNVLPIVEVLVIVDIVYVALQIRQTSARAPYGARATTCSTATAVNPQSGRQANKAGNDHKGSISHVCW